MNNLTTQKIVLGVLMALVLALGVQGTADAITKFTKTSSTDYQVRSINEPFTITFSISAQSSASVKDTDDRLVAEDGSTHIDSSGYPGTWTDHDSDPETPDRFGRTDGAAKVSNSARYRYNDEAIGISVTKGGSTSTDLTLRKSGTPIPLIDSTTRLSAAPTDAAASLYEGAENSNRRLSGSLTGVATAHGKYEITINDITPTTDTPSAYTVATPITFTIYVWRNVSTSRGATIATGDGLSDGIAEQYGTVPLSVELTDPGADYAKVEFEVTRGPGRLYEDKNEDGKPDKSASNRLTTFTNNLGDEDGVSDKIARVILMPNRGTSHIRAWVSGNAPGTSEKSTEAIYSYGFSQLKKISGDSPRQTAPASSRLEAPFVVQLVDSTGRTTIPGADITFEVTTDDSGSDVKGTLAKDPSFPDDLYATNFPTAPATVTTDSNGRASVFLVMSTSGDQSVTATFGGDTSGAVTFNAEISSADPRTPQTIEILPGTDGQKANQYGVLEKALAVVVRDQYGARLPDIVVEFEARDGGTLSNPMQGDPGTVPTPTDPPTHDSTDRRRDIITDDSGEASVRYLAAEDSGAQKVTATLEKGSRRFRTFTINGASSTSGGSGDDDDDDDPPPTTITRTLDIDVSGSGNTREVTVTALENGVSQRGISVSLSVSSGASLSQTSGGTPLESTLTLPQRADTYTLRASTTASGYSAVTEDIEVTLPGTLSISTIGTSTGAQQVAVTARRNGSLQGEVNFTISGSGIVPATGVTTAAGSGNAILNFPRTGTYALTVSADGYDDLPVSVRITTAGQQATTTTTTTGTAGVAESIEIDGNRRPSGTLAESMRLRARVLDANDNGVRDVAVTFRVLAPGRGTFAGARGNGRAVSTDTDRSGYATANFTPTSATDAGTITVEAKAARVRDAVTFIIDIDGATGSATTGDTTAPREYNVGDKIPISLEGTLTFRGSRTLSGMIYTCVGSGECVVSYGLVVKGQIQASPVKTTAPREYNVGDKIPISLEDTLSFRGSRTLNGTTYKCVGSGECVISYGLVAKGQIQVRTAPSTAPRTTEINPVVHIGAANRPPMVWADSGTIYALVGAEVQAFISGVEGAMNIAIAGNKVYWTEKTGENSGTINSANLDGSGAKELKSIMAVPMGIAVDTTANKVYWTNSRGRIQSLNADGSGRVENVWQNLPSPMDIAVARGNLYWTQYDATAGTGSLGIANPTGRGTPKYISTDSDAPLNLVIAGNKVYWTEQTGTSSGTINAANLNGNGAAQLAAIRAVPRGIAVDTARSKLYWTNSRGRVQSANLDGSKIQNVVDGLGMPGDMVVSNSIKAPTAATTPSTAKSTTPAANKYDVNGDGTVDSKDSDALIVAVAAKITDAKYDVNGDGKVDINDVVAVTANRSAGAASAPTLLGTKLSALEIGTLQEQIDLLIATGDRSPAAMQTLIYLQQLIVMARPEKTQLLANYPNPFNPETWMPYELATDTDVKITIYNAQGVVVRVLSLGQQSAGYYTDRERAAYWDGRNALGEQVASGLYVYQLETDSLSLLRKMVILK